MMKSVSLPDCDFDDPRSVVASFIVAMNRWEIAAWEAQRACRDSSDPAAYQAPVLREMNQIFTAFCTQKDRKFGRQGSFQQPPEYDPTAEHITNVTVDQCRKRAYVTTERQVILGGGTYRYVLQKKEASG